jgi:ligand-binding SRPBCC domain-containing protein
MEVTGLERPCLLIEEQRQGPFRRWITTHRFEPINEGTLLSLRVEFEPPGGILGLTVTEAFIRRELEWIFQHRAERLRERCTN